MSTPLSDVAIYVINNSGFSDAFKSALFNAAEKSSYFTSLLNKFASEGKTISIGAPDGGTSSDENIVVASDMLPDSTKPEDILKSVIMIVHELGHAELPSGDLTVEDARTLLEAIKNGEISEGTAITTEFIVAKQLNTDMYTDEAQSELEQIAKDGGVDVTSMTDITSSATTLFCNASSPAVLAAGKIAGEILQPSGTNGVVYDQDFGSQWLIKNFTGTDFSKTDWSGIKMDAVVYSNNSLSLPTYNDKGVKSSETSYTYDQNGVETSKSIYTYDANGFKTGDSWHKSDGSYGSDTFGIHGSGSGTCYKSDGSYNNYTNDGKGNLTSSSYDALTGAYIYNDVSVDGSILTSYINKDGSSTTCTYDAITGVHGYSVVNSDKSTINYETTYDGQGGYHQTWQDSTGRSGENDKSADGSTMTEVVNADGSSTISTYNAQTGVYGYEVMNKDGSYIDYETTYGDNGSYQQSWQDSTGRNGENDKSVDGSTFTKVVNADGSSTTSTFDVQTGVYGYDVHNADGSSIDYQTSYGDNGSYQQSWHDSTGRSGENDKSADGSTMTEVVNADGSSTISTYNAQTGVYGYEVMNNDGSYIDYETTYGDNGSYQQSWRDSTGRSGENDKSVDGSTITEVTNADGSSTISTFDTQTGVYGYEVKNTDGSSIDYETTYGDNGSYQQSWHDSTGRSGENDKSVDGSTLTEVTNADGSSTISTFDTQTGVYGYEIKNTDGSSIDYETTYGDNGSYQQSWHDSTGRNGDSWVDLDGNHGSDAYNSDGSGSGSSYYTDNSYNSFTQNADGSFRSDNYGPDGSLQQENVGRSDGSWSTFTDDGHGNTNIDNYDSNGRLVLNEWELNDGSFGQTVYNPDGSYSTLINDGKGDVTTDYYNSNGWKTGDAWQNSDGSHGDDSFNLTTGIDTSNSYSMDGSHSVTVSKGDNESVSDYFNAQDQLVKEVRFADGELDIEYTYTYDANGAKSGDTWQAGNHNHGNDSFSSDGSSSGIGYYQDSTRSYENKVNTDGSAEYKTLDVFNDGSSYSDDRILSTDSSAEEIISFTGSDGSWWNSDVKSEVDGSYVSQASGSDGSYSHETYNASSGVDQGVVVSPSTGTTTSYFSIEDPSGFSENKTTVIFGDGSWTLGDHIDYQDGSFSYSDAWSNGSYIIGDFNAISGASSGVEYSAVTGKTIVSNDSPGPDGSYEYTQSCAFDDGSWTFHNVKQEPDGSQEILDINTDANGLTHTVEQYLVASETEVVSTWSQNGSWQTCDDKYYIDGSYTKIIVSDAGHYSIENFDNDSGQYSYSEGTGTAGVAPPPVMDLTQPDQLFGPEETNVAQLIQAMSNFNPDSSIGITEMLSQNPPAITDYTLTMPQANA